MMLHSWAFSFASIVYRVENIPSEKGELAILFKKDILNIFLSLSLSLSLNQLSITRLCGKNGAHIPAV